jgi:hypothetical protein
MHADAVGVVSWQWHRDKLLPNDIAAPIVCGWETDI